MRKRRVVRLQLTRQTQPPLRKFNMCPIDPTKEPLTYSIVDGLN